MMSDRGIRDTAAQRKKPSKAVRLRGLAQIAIGVGALGFVVLRSDTRALAEAGRATRISLLPLALIAALVFQWMMAYRWGLILSARGAKVKTRRLFVYYLISTFFSNFVPGGVVTGDLTRLVYAGREIGDRAFVLSTLIYERMTGMFTLLLCGLGASLASRVYRPNSRVFYIGEAILALAFVASAALMSDHISTRLARICRSAGRRLGLSRVGEAVSRTLEAISAFRHHKKLFVGTVILSVGIRVIWSLGCYVVALAMGLPLGLPVIFAFISIVDLIRMLPISIGGLGVREWTMIALFANVGIAREQALMFSFLVFAPIVLIAIAGGLVYIWRADILVADVAAERVEA
jgi:glycosyltransferase 2 family protein